MRFIFVGGCGRSGTTLIQKLLSSHSKIAGGPEFDHTRDLFHLYQKMVTPAALKIQSYYYDKAKVTKSYQSFYKSFFIDLASRKPDAIYVSEKTPTNIQVADTLLNVFPDSLFINVVRDGRDVLLSHRDVNRRYRENGHAVSRSDWALPIICRLWNSAVDKYFKLLKNPDFSKRILTVKFEDLAANPGSELARLFGFLGLDLEEHLLHPEKITEKHTGAVVNDLWYTQDMYRQGFNSQKIGRWKKELEAQGRILASLWMAENLNKLGYELNPFYLRTSHILRTLKNLCTVTSNSDDKRVIRNLMNS